MMLRELAGSLSSTRYASVNAGADLLIPQMSLSLIGGILCSLKSSDRKRQSVIVLQAATLAWEEIPIMTDSRGYDEVTA